MNEPILRFAQNDTTRPPSTRFTAHRSLLTNTAPSLQGIRFPPDRLGEGAPISAVPKILAVIPRTRTGVILLAAGLLAAGLGAAILTTPAYRPDLGDPALNFDLNGTRSRQTAVARRSWWTGDR